MLLFYISLEPSNILFDLSIIFVHPLSKSFYFRIFQIETLLKKLLDPGSSLLYEIYDNMISLSNVFIESRVAHLFIL